MQKKSKRELGASLVEYGLLIALIAVVAVVAVRNVGTWTYVTFEDTALEVGAGGCTTCSMGP